MEGLGSIMGSVSPMRGKVTEGLPVDGRANRWVVVVLVSAFGPLLVVMVIVRCRWCWSRYFTGIEVDSKAEHEVDIVSTQGCGVPGRRSIGAVMGTRAVEVSQAVEVGGRTRGSRIRGLAGVTFALAPLRLDLG